MSLGIERTIVHTRLKLLNPDISDDQIDQILDDYLDGKAVALMEQYNLSGRLIWDALLTYQTRYGRLCELGRLLAEMGTPE